MDRKQKSLLNLALIANRDWTDKLISSIAYYTRLSERTVREWYLDELEEDKTPPRRKNKRNLDASVLKAVSQDDQDEENKNDHLRQKRQRQESPEKAATEQSCDTNSSSKSVENERAKKQQATLSLNLEPKQYKRLILLNIDESEYDATMQRLLKPFIKYEGFIK